MDLCVGMLVCGVCRRPLPSPVVAVWTPGVVTEIISLLSSQFPPGSQPSPTQNGPVAGPDGRAGGVGAVQQGGPPLCPPRPGGGHQTPADTERDPGPAGEEEEQGGGEAAPGHGGHRPGGHG